MDDDVPRHLLKRLEVVAERLLDEVTLLELIVDRHFNSAPRPGTPL
jgi:hypothetical protein